MRGFDNMEMIQNECNRSKDVLSKSEILAYGFGDFGMRKVRRL